MEVELDTSRTIEQNAAFYFEKAKKARKKVEGIKKALLMFEKEKEQLLAKKEKELKEYEQKEQERKKPKREKEWYEKFRWFISSEGFLCIGGRDATTNEIVIKKYTCEEDMVFHTEAPGSPFFVIKTQGKKPGETTIQETAQAAAIYSRAWKMGITYVEAFWIMPAQVSKQAKPGEYLAKGSFMIYGRKNRTKIAMEMAIGITKQGIIMGGPATAIKKNCEKYAVLKQGTEKKSDIAKKIKKEIGGEVDDIISALPSGEFLIAKS